MKSVSANANETRSPQAPTVAPGHRLRNLGAWMVSIAAIGALGYGAWWFSRPEVAPIRDVEVRGEFHYLGGKDIEVAIRPFLPEGFWGLDMNALKAALLRSPWVEDAELRRVWPGKLVVVLRERTALAHWAAGGFVSTEGVQFTPTRGPEGLVVLGGPEGSSQDVAEQYRQLAPLIADAGLSLREFEADARRSWRMRVERSRDNGVESIELKLGGAELGARVQRFVTVYRQVMANDTRRLANVDLRYSNGLAVRYVATEERG
ncbi:MAG: FtsQ-type POTRA domain-containing protein [Gammaproteobacteria bacterium]|nr:cell division protein FtsQ/DivIB [Gammaproteobacteria bacterium]MCP5137232.1 FtsQ-type POTRA domain-containing protein [Gammaproteobacteria bacterium]